MRIKLKCDKDKYDSIKSKLNSLGLCVCDDAEWLLTEIKTNDNITIKTLNGYKILKLEDIIAIESFDHIIYIYDCNNEYKVRKSLKDIEDELSNIFIRISKSVIVNKKAITHISTFTGQKFNVTMVNHKKFIVTKSYYKSFIEEMDL